MANDKNLIPVYYEVYEPWEHLPTDVIQLGEIPEERATKIIQSLRILSGTRKSTCMARVHAEYSRNSSVSFNTAMRDHTPCDGQRFSISGMELSGPSKCTHKKWKEENAAQNCLKNMQHGKCVCPAGRVIAAALWPEMYAKNKQNTK